MSSMKNITDKEQYFRDLMHQVNLSALILDLEGRIIYCNPFLLELTGYSEEEILGADWFSTFIPGDHPEVKAIHAHARETGKPREEFVNPILTKDQRPVYIKWNNSVLRDPHGNVMAFTSIGENISDQKKTEEALSRSEEKFQKAFNNSPDAITITRASDGLLVEVNERMIRLSGYTREEIIGTTTLGLKLWVHQEDRERYIALLKQQGRVSDFETKFRTKQGVEGDYLVSGEMYEMDGDLYVLGIIRDITEKKKHVELLEYQSNLLRQMGEVARIGGWEFDPVTGQGTWTEEVAKIHDLDPSQATNLDLGLSFYQGEDRKIIEKAVKDAIDAGKPYDLELQLHSASGRVKWIHTIGHPVLKEGKTVKVRGSIQDITDRKTKEEEMLRRETLLRNAVENLPLIFYVINQQGEFLLSTGAGLKGLGLKSNEVLGQSVFELYKDFPEVLKAVEKALTGEPDYFCVTVNESSYDNYLIPLENLRGERDGLVGVAMDITERIRSEEAIREGEIKYRKIFENVQDVFYQIDLQGDIIDISPSVYRLSGYTREELIGKPAAIFYANPGDREKMVEKVFKEKEVWDYEVAMRTKDGSIRYASLNAHILLDKEARPAGLEGTLRDIQERKTFEADLISAKERAEESDRLKTAFLHNISHEIRTPMNAIIGFTEILKKQAHSQEDKESYLKIVQESSHQLLSIIDDIVNISSIEANVVKTDFGEVNINATLKSLLKQFSLRAADRKIGFEYHAPLADEESRVLSDHTKLVQILSNLLENAFKFTDSGKIRFGYEQKGASLEFFVADTGTGIAKEEHDKVFHTFYQAEQSGEAIPEGTGLGLSICKAYTELLGGKIWLESVPGKGTTFFFTIPYAPIHPGGDSDSGIAQAEAISFSKDYRILVAEDDDSNYILIDMFLTRLGARVTRARSGTEAVNLCRAGEPPDLVLMDIKMPGMDGYEAIREIRKFLPDLPVIAQTAYAYDESKAAEAGCNAFLSKPFSNAVLAEKIETCLK